MQKKLVLFDIDYTLFDTKAFIESNLTSFSLYEEVREVLTALQENCELGVFSEGEENFQKRKLIETAIYDFFPNTHIVINKIESMGEVLRKYSDYKLSFVEDKLENLKEAKQVVPELFTIWIKRGPFADSQENIGFSPDVVVESLRDIIPVIINS